MEKQEEQRRMERKSKRDEDAEDDGAADDDESDADDERSIQFAVVQNLGPDELPRLTGGARLIVKRELGDSLPVEHYFPEAFTDEPAPLESTEASRVISRNRDKIVRSAVSMGVIRALTMHTYDNGQKPVYVVIEEQLERLYQKVRLPYTPLAPYKHLADYNTSNMAAAIHPAEVLAAIQPENHINAPVMGAFYGGAEMHKGLGHFDSTLIRSM